ncbi:MAG TPA: ABC transporter permease [Tepidiformaceae bacterium]|nr:ABC transporter permease [Tepidiformaceae bacterium]
MALNSVAADPLSADFQPRPPRPFIVRVFLQLVREERVGFWGGLVPIVLMILLAVFAPLIAQAPPNQQNGDVLLHAPSFAHLLGTDENGRDVLARVAYGARVSLWVGFASVCIGVAIATVIGMVSGSAGGWVDLVLQRVVDVLMAFPSFVLILLIAAVLGPGERNTIIAIAVFLLAGPSRVIRGQVLAVKGNVYIEAAEVIGCSHTRVLIHHILPNVFDVIVVIMSINIAFAIITEAALSFIGLGIPPPNPDWGSMVSGTETAYLAQAPWIIAAAGGALAITVYAFNMLGDSLRDILDPRLRQL